MPKSQTWPYEVHSMDDKKINFSQVTLTVHEAHPAKDGTSKAGRDYHLPPRVSFKEDPEREDWMWKAWSDENGFEDYSGTLPSPGDVVQVKLKASYKGGEDSGEFYRDVHDMYHSVGAVAAPSQVAAQGAAPALAGGSATSALGRLSVQEQIAATAMSNVMLLQVWMETEDGDSWKEMIRSAVKKIGQAQIPPSLLGIAKSVAEAQPEPQAPEPPAEVAEPPASDDLTTLPDKVEDLPW